MLSYLEFEKPIAELEGKAQELQVMAQNAELNVDEETARLKAKARKRLQEIYARLTPWHKCLVARHPQRPRARTYIDALFSEFMPLLGDRAFAEDRALLGGLARFHGAPVMVLGQEKGIDTKSRIAHNFGMMRPEGYRKTVRLMGLAERFRLPVICLVDTPGAYPGKGAEERGQAQAIACTLDHSLSLTVPIVAMVIGEGGSGGAVALATANRVAMMEHAIYSVITPEGCASILWKSAQKAQDAASALRLTAQDLLAMGVVDQIVPEPLGGAHRSPPDAWKAVDAALQTMLGDLASLDGAALKAARREKFLAMGTA